MKQVFAAGPLTERPTVRATSAGVSADQLQTALGFANYATPPVRTGDGEIALPSPVRLALLNTLTTGRVLTHTASTGNRYFAHSLLNVPATADAQLAIQTWGSPAWQRSDPDSAADLPELPYLPVADILDDDALKAWLGSPTHRELLEFALHALLGTPSDVRIVLAASADDVAKIVYAVTRVLPSSLIEDFTFSTYEANPHSCTARLIGHDAGNPDTELPEDCYRDGYIGLNLATGRRSDVSKDVPFAAFAVKALSDGKFDKLDEVKGHWQRLGLSDAKHFDLVFRLTRGTGVLTKDEAVVALSFPAVAAWVSARSDAMNQFLEWSLDDRAFATGSFSRAVQPLRQKPDAILKLANVVREEGTKAVTEGDINRAANAIEVVMPMVAPSKANAIWGELLSQIPEPDALTWEMRRYLLPRFVRFKQQSQSATATIDAAFTKWLNVPAEKLGELLSLDLPRGYQMAACRACLHRVGEPTTALAETLANHPRLALSLLQPSEGVEADKAVSLYGTLLTAVPTHTWFEDVIGAASGFDKPRLNRFFLATLDAGKIDADRLIRTRGPALLELFAGESGLDRVGKLFLNAPPADLLHSLGLQDFLVKLAEQDNLSEELKSRIAAVRAIRGYLDSPTFTTEAMTPTADALIVQPPVVPLAAKGEVFAAVATGLLKRSESASVQPQLEAVLTTFGTSLANDSADLYENLLRDLRNRTDFGRNENLVHTFLAVALGATQTESLTGKLDNLDGHAFAVATEAASRGGNRLLNTIDTHSKSWPKEARTKWGFLLAAVRPEGMMRAARHTMWFAIGAAVASAAWWFMR